MQKFELAMLIPYYDNPQGLKESLLSVEFDKELAIVVVDDGSKTPISKEFIASMLSPSVKAEIFLVRQKVNMGVRKALNTGLYFIKSHLNVRYISRLDTGDQCLYQRLDKQYQFLEDNKDVGLAGTNVLFFNKGNEKAFRFKSPENHDKIRNWMNVYCCFIHPSVMFRIEVLKDIRFYPSGYDHAEDYAFFHEILKKYRGANLQEYLTLSEINTHGISLGNRKKQLVSRLKVIVNYSPFNWYSFYGIVRTLMLLVTPYKFIENVKINRG